MTIILGGGLGGLSAAHYLLKKNKSVISIIESSGRLGGWIKTEKHDKNGFIFEVGPRTMRPTKNTLELVEELGLHNKISPISSSHKAAKNRMIYINERLCLLPSDFKGFFKKLPPFSKPLIFSLFHDILTSKSKEKLKDESMYDFAERRFGTEVAKYLISSMICGICAGDAKEISVKFLMKDIFLKEQKYGGVMKGLLLDYIKSEKIVDLCKSALAKRAKDEKWSIYSFNDGMEVLPITMGEYLKKLNVNIQLNTKCNDILFESNEVVLTNNGKTEKTNYLISSIPSYRLADLVQKQHPALASELNGIPFVDVAVVNLQYDSSDLIKQEGFGFLIPPSENLPILGITFDSCCFDMKGNTVLTVMMGGKLFKEKFGANPSETDLYNIATNHVKKILKIEQTPKLARINLLKRCIPQYIVGHNERVERIIKYILDNKLPLGICGSSFNGIGVNDVILSSKNLVNSIY